MDKLMTLTEMTATHPMADLCSGTKIDKATQQSIFDWFQFRYVCDNVKFPVFFNRKLKLVERQYNQLLRVNLTEFDPMVSEYLEREIKRAETQTGTSKKTTSGTATETGGSTSTDSGSDVTDFTTQRDGTESGTNGSTTDFTTKRDGTASGTTGSTTDYTHSGTSKDETTESTSGTHMSLTGATPDSSLYPDQGFPEGLRWQFASGQGENKDVTTGTTTTNGTTGQTDKTTVAGTSSDTTNSTGTDKTIVEGTTSGTTSLGGTDKTTVQHGKKTEVSDNRSTTTEGSDTTTDDSTANSDVKERMTGRHEAPQDMMGRAVTFIMKTNAFLYLIQQLEDVFFAFYEEEW